MHNTTTIPLSPSQLLSQHLNGVASVSQREPVSFLAGPLGRMQLEMIYAWCDGPGLFLATNYQQCPFLFYWTANLDPDFSVSFLIARTTPDEMRELQAGEIDLFSFFMDKFDAGGTLDYLYFNREGKAHSPAPLLPIDSDSLHHQRVGAEFAADLLPDPRVFVC